MENIPSSTYHIQKPQESLAPERRTRPCQIIRIFLQQSAEIL